MPTLLLVRHGRTAANATGQLAGWTPGVGLDDTGREHARALGERLRGLPVVLAAVSPLQRCQETADELYAAAAWSDARRVTADDLGECHYGAWTGRPLAELATEELWRTVQDHPSRARFPDSPEHRAESIADMAHRAVAAVRRLDRLVEAEQGPDALWVAVSHGDVIKAIVADAAGTHLDHFQRFMAGPASVSVIRYTAARPFVIRTNDSGGDLSGLVPTRSADETPRGDAAVGGGTA
ncbi:MSMEG_4193 family putative phosphomutase [Arsenicicoccus sp. oral taxon 190]|uniref:MSMEG_4193 family putative phosphomutase n=1 Tax=Arsenicicoccus sp. oral taxon 190 TaxID=1658671 RepID=UPI000679F334|nr:MSMEG_4193 family putative phosphomutase [Arsenicicoccus sp. oral taxon 190]AKT51927.1 phosphoglycerate mutase [Arsenicicoccus sp. oral taxon 190]